MAFPGVVLLATAAAGRLFVAPGTLPEGARIEITSVSTGVSEAREVGKEGAAFAQPPGEIVVSVFSPNGKTRGFMRLTVRSGEELGIVDPPVPARGRGQLGAVLSFPKDAASGRKEVALFLVGGGKKLRPDVVVDADTSHLFAFWLDAPARPVRIVTESRAWTLAKALEAEIPDRGAFAASGELVVKPSITVRFDAGDAALHGPADVELLDCEKQAGHTGPLPVPLCTLRATELGSSRGSFVFHELDPSLYALRWTRGPLRDTLEMDLHDARSIEKVIALRTFEVSGRVTAGGKESPATLVWEPVNSGLTFEAKAGEDGQYRVPLVRRGRYLVKVAIEGLEPDTRLQRFEGDEFRDERRDFDVPWNRITVRVLDAKTAEPVPGAAVGWGPADDDRGGSVSNADELGTLALPPLRIGKWEISAWTKGYRQPTPTILDVDAKTRERTLTIALQKSAGPKIRVLDPDGAPAAGGFLTGDGFGGGADAEGRVTLDDPLETGQAFSAWDARGRLGVFRWSGEEEQVVRIPPSGPPFAVRFLSEDGKPRPGWVATFSIDGIRVTPSGNRQNKAGGDVKAGADGRQILAGLPAFGVVTLIPAWKADAAVTRTLPVTEEIVFIVPPAPGR